MTPATPEDFARQMAAAFVADTQSSRDGGDEFNDYQASWLHVGVAIAALVAADREAVRAEERERCCGIVLGNPNIDARHVIAAAIRAPAPESGGTCPKCNGYGEVCWVGQSLGPCAPNRDHPSVPCPRCSAAKKEGAK